jgi:hypothetical protein
VVLLHLLVVFEFEVTKELLIVRQQKDGPLGGESVLGGGRLTRGCLPVGAEAGSGDVALVAGAADERPLVVVQPPATTPHVKK